MAQTITVYQKPTCTTCRQVAAALREAGVPFESVNYFADPIPAATLRTLLKKMGLTARQLLRTKEARYKALKLGEREMTDEALVRLMVEFPELIERPIVERGARAILARPADRIREFLR
jgi:arsenate reductase